MHAFPLTCCQTAPCLCCSCFLPNQFCLPPPFSLFLFFHTRCCSWMELGFHSCPRLPYVLHVNSFRKRFPLSEKCVGLGIWTVGTYTNIPGGRYMCRGSSGMIPPMLTLTLLPCYLLRHIVILVSVQHTHAVSNKQRKHS